MVVWVLSLIGFYFTLQKRDNILARGQYAYISADDCENIKDLEGKIIDGTVKSWAAGKALKPCIIFLDNVVIPACLASALLIAIVFAIYLLVSSFTGLDVNFCNDKLTILLEIGKSFVLPLVSTIFGALFSFWRMRQRYFRLRNNLVCIDDIERANKLNPQDILHLAADLRDNNNCKVALILNDDLFCDEDGQLKLEKSAAWKVALEKGSDRHFCLKLSAEDAVRLALGEIVVGEDYRKDRLRCYVVSLEINNIRVILRLYNDFSRFRERLEKEKKIQLGPELWDDLVFLIVVTGYIKYFHPEKIAEAEKVDAEAQERKRENSLESSKQPLKSKVEAGRVASNDLEEEQKSEAEILTGLVTKEVEKQIQIFRQVLTMQLGLLLHTSWMVSYHLMLERF
ncbi:MFS transporter [Acetobacteraceae bacterium]|nr:MFS transporter [Acetobacteraceae bacterium]